MSEYNHIKNELLSYGVRDLSRGKLTKAIKQSSNQAVIVMKSNKPKSVIISYQEYLNLLKGKNNER